MRSDSGHKGIAMPALRPELWYDVKGGHLKEYIFSLSTGEADKRGFSAWWLDSLKKKKWKAAGLMRDPDSKRR